MTRRETGQRLKKAVENTTPDVLAEILSQCETPKGKIIMTENNTAQRHAWTKWIAAAAAALALFAGGMIASRSLFGAQRIDSVILIDVNPSIELSVSADETVLGVSALNDDARGILGDMDLTGAKLDVALNALVGSMLRNGYISELANSILISVENGDAARGAALQQRLTEVVNGLLSDNAVDGAVLAQCVAPTDELQRTAQTYGISVGKVRLIEQLTAADPALVFEELCGLSINELNLLAESRGVTLAGTTATGTASSARYIGAQRARELALAAAGVAEADASRFEIDFDCERGVMVYEVEFYAGGREYEYDVNAETGEIVKTDGGAVSGSGGGHGTGGAGSGSGNGVGAAAGYIGKQRALQTALDGAGLAESGVTELHAEFDVENGVAVYEVEFKAGGLEYDYTVDAVTGAVLHSRTERDDDAPGGIADDFDDVFDDDDDYDDAFDDDDDHDIDDDDDDRDDDD